MCDERNGSQGANIVWFYCQQRPMNRHPGSAALCHKKKTLSVALSQAYQSRDNLRKVLIGTQTQHAKPSANNRTKRRNYGSMPAALTGSHFKGIHNGYDQVMNGGMRGTLDAKNAAQVNTALERLAMTCCAKPTLAKATCETSPRISAPI